MGDEFGPIRQLANSFHSRERLKLERLDNLTVIRLMLAVMFVFFLLSVGRLATYAQEPAQHEQLANSSPLMEITECGQLSLLLEGYVTTLWSQCHHRTLYAVAYCGIYMTFELTVKATEEVKLHYSWFCNPPSYATEATCADFPGELHIRLLDEKNRTIEEWSCPS